MATTIVQINDLIDQHGKSFAECKGCSICKQIEGLRESISKKPNPKIEKTLAKGIDMTKSDIAYLISREVNKSDIKKAMKIGSMEFHRLLVNWGFRKEKGMGRMPKLEMSVEEYKGYKEKGMSDKKVAEEKGVAAGTIDYWKKKHHISSYSDLIKKETNTPRKEKETLHESEKGVIDSLKRELEVREKAIKDLEEKLEDSVKLERYKRQGDKLKYVFETLEKEQGKRWECEEKYQKEHALVINLDAELENLREQLRSTNETKDRYVLENEHLRELVKNYNKLLF